MIATHYWVGFLACDEPFHRLTQHQKILAAKLIHGLANTNHQNSLYYWSFKQCSCCQTTKETFEYVLSYPENSSLHDDQL